MILDSQTSLSRAQSIVSGTGDVISTDIYDFGAAADPGIGEETMIQINVNTAVAGAGASVQFVLQTADDAAFSVNNTEYPLTAARGVALLTANSVQYQGSVPNLSRRFLRIVYRITGASTTAGTVTAFLAKNLQASPILPTTVPGVK